MILTDQEIQKKLKNKEIEITPKPDLEQLQPCSIDLRLSNEFWTINPSEEVLDIYTQEPKYTILQADAIILPPNQFLLATTREKVKIPNNLCARVEGRSSLARLGLAVHITAGFIDAGFNGQITLEIKNQSPNSILIHSDMRICQITFEELTGEVKNPYGTINNKYQHQEGVCGSLIYWDNENMRI